ncbi:TPA: superoxide dismutase [Fe] [Candidatus Uhrbacteria bacterium]|uniref:Superoxide dismutase n=2 Tax=Candidatus Uhriibacteriota TaxID=1752732 RepID=A0A0G1QA44_9BACT|nr:MAG: Superoxide dismutase [Candidatus Uhrbacteria bacterium GW2011_GWF2_46_218]KKU41657.1 MAG: Superoxide dismutase [Candidatus Uhrbacteria bacterium GW2011_GWE2_46_68]HBK33474.1 superoxide dismutase [Fe] [Candidatus Uhrbacteria bacterium]HCB19615.1 superoxide dismutase [Fe] [Candidatus Uhrbacteria bacterium]
MFSLPSLPFDSNALKEFLSKETFDYHHGKHHAGYVATLNAMIENTPWAEKTLEKIIEGTRGNTPSIFHPAAQHFNHAFFWNCLSSETQSIPESLQKRLSASFKSENEFTRIFTDTALALFGSGWIWLVQNPDTTLGILSTTNAETPVATSQKPLLTLDLWEHAYYIDYRNDRARFVENFWNHINWNYVTSLLS